MAFVPLVPLLATLLLLCGSMPEIALALSSDNRKTTWATRLRVVNYVAEKSSSNGVIGINRIQRPGLAPYVEVGTGPIRGLLRQAGTFDGDLMAVSGEELYRINASGIDTLVGAIPGDFITTSDATVSRAIFVSDGVAYSTNGTTVTPVVMPDSRLVGSVAQLNGYFILTELGSARYYWIEPGQTNPDGLSFATTVSSPGSIVKAQRVGDEVWFMKEEGSEVHSFTGDADLPFQRVPGRNFDKGCRSRDGVSRFDNSFGWIGNDAIIYRADAGPIRISDNTVEEFVRKSDIASLKMFSFACDGHTYLGVSSNTGTHAYDASSTQWTEFSSWGRPAFRINVVEQLEQFVVAGDEETGAIYRFDPDRSNDNGEPMERILTGGIASAGGSAPFDNLALFITTGTATDPNLRPRVEVRVSKNNRTFGDPRFIALEPQGNYGAPVRLNRLGSINYPGALIEFRVVDDVVATIQGAAYNVPLR